MKHFSVDFCDTEPNFYKIERDEQGNIIDKTAPAIAHEVFTSECTVNFDGIDPTKAEFYIGVDCEVGCFIQVGDTAINLDFGFSDLYGLKLYLDNLFAMPADDEKELHLSTDEIRALLAERDEKYRRLLKEKQAKLSSDVGRKVMKLKPIQWDKQSPHNQIATIMGLTLSVYKNNGKWEARLLNLFSRPEIQQGFETAEEAEHYAESVLLTRELKKYFDYD